jgi:YD repeat-containing protein
LYVETLTKQDATTTLDSYKYFDGLGRAWRTALKEDTSAYTISDTQYDSLGRVWKISNPYRATTLTGAANLATATTTLYDALGRVLSVTTPDGAVVTTSYSGTQVTVKDQANKQRRSLTDALGRLAKVEELSESATISSTTPIYSTTLYGYDVLGNLRSVRQGGAVQGDGTMTGGQTRSFEYDSLSRLTSAMNPESGTISYQYDGNGNVLTKRDARGITTTYGYDALNRVQTRSYIGDTPAVTYTYDAAGVTNSKGRLTSLSSSVSTTSYGEYDALGRVKQSTQTTSGAPSSYVMSYGYDLAGHKTSETYPSGRVITTVYGGAGREQSVAGQISGANKTYASQFSYSAHGAVSAMQLGNGLWEHTAFNNRLQPEQIGLGTLSTNASILQLDYTYHAPNAADNNGNVQTQTITIPGLAVTQSYSYDSLNRLQVAQEQSGTSWKQAFRYDQFGNRNFDAGTTTTDLASKVTNPTISTATNQIDGTAAGQVNILYDPAGNLTRCQRSNVWV